MKRFITLFLIGLSLLTFSCMTSKTLNKDVWTLSEILEKNGELVSVNDLLEIKNQNVPYISFYDNNEAKGFSGVNLITMKYALDEKNNELSFQEGISTLALGTEAENYLESLYKEHLHNTVKFRLENKMLTLCSSEGKALMIFKSAK